MNELKIRDTALEIKEFHGQRVVTLRDIDAVHKRPYGTARKRFNDNKNHFIDGVDCFVRNTDEAKNEYGIVAPNGLTLITESGYLMLVKSFTDDLAWQVQRELVNNYFKPQNEKTTSIDALIKCAEIMARCEDKNRPYVINILSGIVPGIEDAKSKDDGYNHENGLKPYHTFDNSGNRYWISRAGYNVPFDRTALGRKLAEKNMSEYDLATMVHCDVTYVRRWLRGENRPGAAYRDKICLALNVRSGTFDHAPNRR